MHEHDVACDLLSGGCSYTFEEIGKIRHFYNMTSNQLTPTFKMQLSNDAWTETPNRKSRVSKNRTNIISAATRTANALDEYNTRADLPSLRSFLRSMRKLHG